VLEISLIHNAYICLPSRYASWVGDLKKNKRDDIADSIWCDSVFEERTYLLYKRLADGVKLPFVKSLLLHIAYDSQKHSAILKGISQSIGGSRVKTRDCEKRLGTSLMVSDDISHEIANEKKAPVDSLSSLVKKLSVLESTMGEEYFALVQMKTLQQLTGLIRESYYVDLEYLRDVFETIVRDEKTHLELLAKMKKCVVGQQMKKADTTPAVRYENPDAWRRPCLTRSMKAHCSQFVLIESRAGVSIPDECAALPGRDTEDSSRGREAIGVHSTTRDHR
jgi:rubrerythrin